MADRSSMPQVVIVSPYLRDANNGNWRTAERWRRHLAGVCDARIVDAWPDHRAAADQAMIALHARRSAAAIAAWSAAHPGRGLAVALTGTDLYRDIHADAQARRSLDRAQVLVTLQEQAPPRPARRGARQGPGHLPVGAGPPGPGQDDTPPARPGGGPPARGEVAGHPVRRRPPPGRAAGDVFIDHAGAGLDPALAEAARATMLEAPHYRWLGGLPHEAPRGAASSAPTCWSTPAAWRAAPMSSSRRW
jgi:hypothetical protein